MNHGHPQVVQKQPECIWMYYIQEETAKRTVSGHLMSIFWQVHALCLYKPLLAHSHVGARLLTRLGMAAAKISHRLRVTYNGHLQGPPTRVTYKRSASRSSISRHLETSQDSPDCRCSVAAFVS